MGTIFKLYFTQMNQRYGLSMFKYNLKHLKENTFKTIGIPILIAFAMCELIGVYSFMCFNIFKIADMVKHPEIMISLIFMVSQALTFLFGMFFILGTVFFAKDSEFLSSLPVKQWQVFSSKFLIVYSSELILTLAVTAPPVIIYGIGIQAGFLFYIKALITALCLPLIPLAAASLISLLLMGFVSRTKHRDLISIIAGGVFVLSMLTGQMLFTSNSEKNMTQALANLFQSSDGFIKLIGGYFPPSIWASLGVVSESGVLYLLAFVGVSLLAVVIIAVVASKIYYAGALAQLESGKRQSGGALKKLSFKTGSPVKAIFIRELKSIFRSPSYALNSLVTVFIGPLLIVLSYFNGKSNLAPLLDMLTKYINTDSVAYIVLGLAVAGALFAAVNPAPSTVYSREGKFIWLAKTIPVPFRSQAAAKLLSMYILSAVSVILTIIAAVICFGIPFYIAIIAAVLALTVIFEFTVVETTVDMLNPKLVWNSEQEAIKQNFNVLIGMGAELLAAVPAVAAFLILKGLNVSPIINGIAVFVISATEAFILFKMFMNLSEKAYKKIEV